MLNTFTHNECQTDDKWGLVKTPNAEFKGVRNGVEFMGGIGRTRDRDLLWEFHEVYGYEVTLATGMEGFGEPAEVEPVVKGRARKREATFPVISD